MLWVRALLQPACLYSLARCLITIASLMRAYLGPVICRKCYNLSANGACAWLAANCPRWSEMIVVISWRGNNNRQQRFDLMERCYLNQFIYLFIYLFYSFYIFYLFYLFIVLWVHSDKWVQKIMTIMSILMIIFIFTFHTTHDSRMISNVNHSLAFTFDHVSPIHNRHFVNLLPVLLQFDLHFRSCITHS